MSVLPKIRPPKQAQADQLDFSNFVPDEFRELENPQTAIPRIAKDPDAVKTIERAIHTIPTTHDLYRGDARNMVVKPESVHLVLTSPPYWTLKEYRETSGQLGHVSDYESFLSELDQVVPLLSRPRFSLIVTISAPIAVERLRE
jgi:modification methylase